MKVPKIQAINAFFSKLPKPQKNAAYILGAFLALIILNQLIVRPVYTKMAQLDKDIRNKQLEIKKSMKILGMKDAILSESAKYAPFLHNIEFGEQEVSSLLKQIENLANNSSVSLIDVKPQGMKELGKVRVYVVALVSEAQMEALFDFMYSIENSNELLSIVRYQITPKSQESSMVSCTMTVYKILMQ